jgi:putative membrane protein
MTDHAADNSATLDTSTRLAFERTRLAHNNTLTSWIRTAASLITFGFTVYKFFQLELAGRDRTAHVIGPREFGLAMITIGLLSLLLGTLEYWRDLKRLRAECPTMPRSTTGVLAAFMLALGIAALLLVILRQ